MGLAPGVHDPTPTGVVYMSARLTYMIEEGARLYARASAAHDGQPRMYESKSGPIAQLEKNCPGEGCDFVVRSSARTGLVFGFGYTVRTANVYGSTRMNKVF